MKLLYKLALPFALLLSTALFSGALWSDTKPGSKAEQNRPDRFELMANRLKLDDKQKAQLKLMVEKLQANREQSMKQLEENEQKELAKVLNANQVKSVQRYLKHSQRAASSRGPEPKRPVPAREARGSREVFPKPPEKLPEKN